MRGFTLLECLIVLTIGALMSVMAISYWDGLLANKAVQQDALLLADTFRTSQMQAWHHIKRFASSWMRTLSN